MRKWAFLLILFAIPLVAQQLDSARIKSLEDSVQSLNHRMEKIEEHWVEIKETADKSGEWARWLMVGGIGLAALFLGFLIVFTLINTSRIKRDMEEVKKIREQAEGILEFLEGARDETIHELERTRKERERLKREGKDVGRIDEKLAELGQRLETFQRMGLPLDAHGWLAKGIELVRAGHFKESVEAFKEAIKLRPKYVDVYNEMASSLLIWGSILKGKEAREKFEKAQKSATKAVQLSKGKQGYYNLACAMARLRKYEEALDYLRRCKEKGFELRIVSLNPWLDPDLEPLQSPFFYEKFEQIVGPPPVEVEKPKAKRKAKPKSTKPKKK